MTTVVAAQGIEKAFTPGEPVLRGVDLAAESGSVTALIGPSGCGKSTFLRCLNLLVTPDAGEVSIDGEVVAFKPSGRGRKLADEKHAAALRAKLGWVSQSFDLWSHLTVLQNVIEAPVHVLGLAKDEAVARAEGLLERVGLSERKDAYPSQISGGQAQRAAIARALAMEPRALLMDEPTSALDPERVGEVLAVIQDLAKEGRTMILATHEIAFARDVADRAIFMNGGIIEEQGPASEVLTNPKSERLQRFLAG